MGRFAFSTAASSSTVGQEELAHVKDMSVHGLCLDSIKAAVNNVITTPVSNAASTGKKSTTETSPLGRWKVGTDNFDKSYSYDHTA